MSPQCRPVVPMPCQPVTGDPEAQSRQQEDVAAGARRICFAADSIAQFPIHTIRSVAHESNQRLCYPLGIT